MSRWQRLQRMDAARMRELQDHLLRRFVREYLPFHGFYREHLAQAGVALDSIRKVDDLRRVPLSSKRDLLPTEDDPQRFRRFILQPDAATLKAAWPLHRKLPLLAQKWLQGADAVKRRLRREFYPSFMTFTTGRSAEPVPFFYTPHDLDVLLETGNRIVDVMALHPEYRVANVFPYAPHLAFWQVFYAGLATGMMALSTGGGKVMGSSGDLRAITRLRAEVLIGVPGYVYHLLRKAAAAGADLSAAKVLVLGAERVPPGMKERMVRLLQSMGAGNVHVFGTYGFTEARMAFTECPTADNSYTGYHVYPDMAIFEVVDPATGEVVPEGCDGELVFTPLQGRGSTVFRYRTGDLVRGGITWEPCPHCGRTLPRIHSDIRRDSNTKDLRLVKVKGTMVNLEDCAQVLGSIPEVEEWQVELRKKDDDPLEVDELVVHLAVRDPSQREAASRKVTEGFRGQLEVQPNRVTFEDLDSMLQRIGMETEMKERRFLDARPRP